MAGKVLLVGCGKMGGALLKGWLEGGKDGADIAIIEPFATAAVSEQFPLAVAEDVDGLAEDFTPAVVVFAVKPQGMAEIAPQYGRFKGPGTVFLSIAAGRPISFFETHLGTGAAIVRSMPNTPAAVGRGITAACANGPVSAAQREDCQALLEAVGEVAWVEDEGLLDAVTAVSGSGPAYVFLLMECLAGAGVASGLPAELADRLARVTVMGSGELARQARESAGTLRENVTSPGGTTAAALEVLMADDGLAPLMKRAIAAATRRSKELAG